MLWSALAIVIIVMVFIVFGLLLWAAILAALALVWKRREALKAFKQGWHSTYDKAPWDEG